MTLNRRDLAALALSLPFAAFGPARPAQASARPALAIVGPDADGGYDQAIRGGADFLTACLTPTKDGALAALPDHALSAFTNIEDRADFAGRRREAMIDGRRVLGWFAEDFTMAELKTLTRRGAGARKRGAALAILSFEEVIAIARIGSVRQARVIGVHATMLRPAYFAGLDLAIEPRLAASISVAGYDSPAAAMFVAADDPASLKTMGTLTRARRVLRIATEAAGDLGPAGLAAIRSSAEAIAPDAGLAINLANRKSAPPTGLIAAAHAAGLSVQAWAKGPGFPPAPYHASDARRLMAAMFAAGADAVAGDAASAVVQARTDASAHARP